MFHFLNTAFLAAMAVVGIPILIHFFARRKAVIVPFGSIRFLRLIQQQKMRSMKLKQILLLFLRSLAVCFLVLSFARPILQSRSGWTQGKAPIAAALILDASASMGRGALYEKAKNRMQTFLNTLKEDDKIAFLESVPDRNQDTVFSRFRGYEIDHLFRKTASFERGDNTEGIARAVKLLERSREPNPEIVLISDMQATGFQGKTDSSALSGYHNRILVLPIQGEIENVAVVRAGIENRIFDPETPVTVFADIRNSGSRKVHELLAGVYLKDSKVSQKSITLEAGETRRLVFSVRPQQTGWIWGNIQIDHDAFPQDNRGYFSFYIPEKVRILLVGKNRSDVQAIRTALVPGKQWNRTFDIEQAFSGESWSDRLSNLDVLVISNYPAFSNPEKKKLNAYLQNGGGLLLFFGKDVILQNYSDWLSAQPFGIQLGPVEGKGGTLSFGTIDFDHSIFQGVFQNGKEKLQSPLIYRWIPTTGKSIQPIISLSNGRPLLSEVQTDSGTLLVFASGLDETWSDAVYTTFFAPLVYRCVVVLANPDPEDESGLKVGDPVRFRIRADSLEHNFRAVIPSGESVRLVPEFEKGQMVFLINHSEAPGNYRLYNGNHLMGIRSVSMDPLESDLKRIEDQKIKRFLPEAKIRFIQDNEKLESAVAEARTGKELWKEMLLFAMVLLIAEMGIAKPWKRE